MPQLSRELDGCGQTKLGGVDTNTCGCVSVSLPKSTVRVHKCSASQSAHQSDAHRKSFFFSFSIKYLVWLEKLILLTCKEV